MTNQKKIKEFIEKNNGYLVVDLIKKNKIPYHSIKFFIKKNNLIKVKRGLYKTENTIEDVLYEKSILNPNIVFSHETALSLHNLMDGIPNEINISTYQGNKLIKNENDINFYNYFYVKKDLFNLGVIEKETIFSNKVKVYDIDRTICDIIKERKMIDSETYNKAWNFYLDSKEKNFTNLAKYAEKMKILDLVNTYMEVVHHY